MECVMSSQPAPKNDLWNSGEAYEAYVGRWSRRIAPEFIRWLDVPTGSRWLDVGCGTGVLSETILRETVPASIRGVDLSAAHVTFAREHIQDPRAQFEVGDAHVLPVESAAYDAVVSGLVLNFIPDPDKGLAEMARAATSGGIIAAYVWDYADGMQMMRYFWSTASALHPDAPGADEGRRFTICKPEPLAALFRRGGLAQVETRSIDIPTHFQNFDDYWTPFLSGQAPAPKYVLSLDEASRAEFREALRARLPLSADGSIELTARVWAVRGRRP